MDSIHGESKIEEEVIEDYIYEIKHAPSDVGWFQCALPQTAMARLWSYCEDPEVVDATQSLAGNVSRSLYLHDKDDWFFKNYVQFMALDHRNSFPDDPLRSLGSRNHEKHPFQLDSLWVNYQRQTEFNPSHTHAGLYSFVIFMKIPYHWEEQYALKHVSRSNSPRAGDFAFEYLSGFGRTRQEVLNMSPEWEGTMLFFPAELNHTVYPFYNCNEERITIAGNVGFNTNVILQTDEEITEKFKAAGQIRYR